MQLGIFAKTFPGSNPESVLSSVANAGFHAAHYNWACSGLASMPDEIPAGYAENVAETAIRHKVKMVGLSATWNMAHPDPAVRQKGLARLEVMAAKASVLGARLITLCTGTRDPEDQWRYHPDNQTSEAWRDMMASMREAVSIAERYNLLLGIEPELANIINDVDATERLFSEISSTRLKLILDPANLFENASQSDVKALVEKAMTKLGSHLAMAHAKDRNAKGEFVAVGKGIVDFEHFIQSLKVIGFDGPLVTHGLTPEEAPGVYNFLHTIFLKHGCLG
ncbi:MAG: sugar phosphate isomerase/epimerase [Hyphomicrobiales bacterium]|nr:sugar phosphate isomerase/epimerase [Hyphomicrobiales bacterium]